jgi:hypothetical protein
MALGGWILLMGFTCLPRSASRDFPSPPWKGEENLELDPPVLVEIDFHALEENEGCGSLCGNFLVFEVVVAEVDGPLLLMSADCGRLSREIREDELVDGTLRVRTTRHLDRGGGVCLQWASEEDGISPGLELLPEDVLEFMTPAARKARRDWYDGRCPVRC